ncbi:hypothetical protein BG004_002452 [Podila humilis]|nr:hypothetical protein BG004_002452 [Podila humilis]
MGRKSGRSLNPADQYRKEQHKKEIKKNKLDRKKVRELGSAIKDTTTEVELAQHEELEKTGKLDKEGLKKLAELREKMSKINDIKKAHGIKIRPKKIETPTPQPVTVEEPLRDPTRSIYYDPVLNPYGAPPPGMPYLEHPPLPIAAPFGQEPPQPPAPEQESEDESEDETDSSGSDSEGSSSSGSDSDSEDDESFLPPLPEGPPPSKEDQARFLAPTKPQPVIDPRLQQQQRGHMMYPGPGTAPPQMYDPPGRPPIMNPYGNLHLPMSNSAKYFLYANEEVALIIHLPHIELGPPSDFGSPIYGNVYPPGRPGPPPMHFIPPPPSSMQMGYGGPPPQGFHGPPGYQGPPPPHGQGQGHRGPPGYGPPQQHGPPYSGPSGSYESHSNRPPPSHRPPPPARYIKPTRTANPQSDPMTGHLPPDEKEVNKQLAAAEKEAAAAAALATKPGSDSTATISEAPPSQTSMHHPLPRKPGSVPSKPVVQAGPTSISAEPQLRNLQKELVHLVPSTIMRKRVTQKGKIGRPVNAAPGVDVDDIPSTTANEGSLSSSILASSSTSEDADTTQDYRETGLGLRLPRINLAPNVQIGPSRIVVNSAPNVPAAEPDRAAKKKAEYDDFLQSLEGEGLL